MSLTHLNFGNGILLILGFFSIGSFALFLQILTQIGFWKKNPPLVSVEEEVEFFLPLDAKIDWFTWIASLSTLLGLLGTVLGIYESFSEMASLGKATIEILAGGIRSALLTTIAGLCVAIPAITYKQILDHQISGLEWLLMKQRKK